MEVDVCGSASGLWDKNIPASSPVILMELEPSLVDEAADSTWSWIVPHMHAVWCLTHVLKFVEIVIVRYSKARSCTSI